MTVPPPSSNRRGASPRFAFTTTRPVAILMVVMAVAVFGIVSYDRLALTLMPDISYPTLSVRTEFPGTAPEEVETLVSRPLEQELGRVPNLVTISSISKAGQSDVILEFSWDTDLLSVAQDIREKVDRVQLPDEAERPLLLRYDPSLDPIIRLGLAGSQSLYELRYLADNEIKRTLEALSGVAAVKVKGGLEEEFQIALDERKLALLNLDIAQVNRSVQQGNVNLPGGTLREGQTEYLVRTLNEFRTLEEIGELIVAQQNGVDIRLRDIAIVRSAHKEREIITRVNGSESIEVEIYKEAGANVVEVARRVREKLFGTGEQRAFMENLRQGGTKPAASPAGLSPMERRQKEAEQAALRVRMSDFVAHQLPAGTGLEVLTDQSTFIEQSIDEVKNNAIVGGLIAILVLYLFLRNLLHTLIIGVTIPISIVATFAPMHLFGVSLNIISLGGLALGVGMLVDNAIVVLESIFRCREEGDELVDAVIRGTGEVGSAVTASTLTTVAVFLPIVFVEGVAGQIFGDMALTVVFSLVASLIVALFLIPMLASRRAANPALREPKGKPAGSESDFLRLAALPEDPSLTDRFAALPKILGGFFSRLATGLAALLVLAAVCIVCLLMFVLWPVYRPVELLRNKGAARWLETVARWAAGNGQGFFDCRVWPGITSTGALLHIRESLMSVRQKIGGTRGAKKILHIAALPVVFIFLAARFVLELILRLLGASLFVCGLLAVLPIFALSRIGAICLQPIIRPVLFVTESVLDGLHWAYRRALDHALAMGAPLIAAVFVFLVAVLYFGIPRLGRELIPAVHQGEFNVDLTMPVGTPLERTAEVAALVEQVALEQKEVVRTATQVGSDRDASSKAEEGEHTGRITVRLAPGSSAAGEEQVIAKIREGIRDVPEIQTEVSYPALFTFKAPIEVEIRGYDLPALLALSRQTETLLSETPGLVDVRSTLQTGNPELQVVYDRDRLSEFGLALGDVAALVRNKIQGSVATDFRRRERLIDVLVRLQETDRLGLDELRNLVVNPGAEIAIPLSAVAAINVAEGPSEIRRIDQERTAVISANTQGIDLGTASLLIEQSLVEIDFPPGFHYAITGQNEEMKVSLDSMLVALALALFLVYIVMASQFESLIHPLIIMFTVPLALIGVVLVLWLAAIPLSVIVFIGLIMLAGIVVNNAIVLIDFINTLRRSGVEMIEAVRQAGQVRLRPILMTTLTTVLGLTPMAFGFGEGAEIRAPMAITVIVGLISSTALTLIIIPTVYVLIERLREPSKS